MRVRLEDNYFSDALKWTIVTLGTLVSGYLIYATSYQWIVFILLIISLISFSTKYVIEVNTEKKLIIDSFYFLWIRIKSEELNFHTLNCIRLDKQRHIYNVTSRAMDRQADFNEYIGTLEYDHGQSVELERKMEYQALAEEMKRISGQLNIPVNRTF
jgi:hypothetical protein